MSKAQFTWEGRRARMWRRRDAGNVFSDEIYINVAAKYTETIQRVWHFIAIHFVLK